jgi:transposase
VRTVAAMFAVSPSFVVKLTQAWRRRGTVAARPQGGDRRSTAIEIGCCRWWSRRLTSPWRRSATGSAKHGTPASISTIWRVFDRYGISLKKRPRRRTDAPGRGHRAPAVAHVPVLGGDIVLELKFDPAAGMVSPNGPGEVATKAGAGPRHLTFHPNGKFAYLITETTATIGTYAVDPASGTLKELQFVDTNEYKEQPAASDIHVTPDGKFLYGAERKTSMLIGYKIDPDKGTLAQIGRFPTEKTPRGFAIDPRGKFLLSFPPYLLRLPDGETGIRKT